jgi:hypothetical protein
MLSFLRRKPAMPGSIWLDEPGAHKSIEAKARHGAITDEEAANL